MRTTKAFPGEGHASSAPPGAGGKSTLMRLRFYPTVKSSRSGEPSPRTNLLVIPSSIRTEGGSTIDTTRPLTQFSQLKAEKKLMKK